MEHASANARRARSAEHATTRQQAWRRQLRRHKRSTTDAHRGLALDVVQHDVVVGCASQHLGAARGELRRWHRSGRPSDVWDEGGWVIHCATSGQWRRVLRTPGAWKWNAASRETLATVRGAIAPCANPRLAPQPDRQRPAAHRTLLHQIPKGDRISWSAAACVLELVAERSRRSCKSTPPCTLHRCSTGVMEL